MLAISAVSSTPGSPQIGRLDNAGVYINGSRVLVNGIDIVATLNALQVENNYLASRLAQAESALLAVDSNNNNDNNRNIYLPRRIDYLGSPTEYSTLTCAVPFTSSGDIRLSPHNTHRGNHAWTLRYLMDFRNATFHLVLRFNTTISGHSGRWIQLGCSSGPFIMKVDGVHSGASPYYWGTITVSADGLESSADWCTGNYCEAGGVPTSYSRQSTHTAFQQSCVSQGTIVFKMVDQYATNNGYDIQSIDLNITSVQPPLSALTRQLAIYNTPDALLSQLNFATSLPNTTSLYSTTTISVLSTTYNVLRFAFTPTSTDTTASASFPIPSGSRAVRITANYDHGSNYNRVRVFQSARGAAVDSGGRLVDLNADASSCMPSVVFPLFSDISLDTLVFQYRHEFIHCSSNCNFNLNLVSLEFLGES